MKRKRGYTIVEVSMALAVSASLVLLTVGLAGMVSNQRFKNSMSANMAFIQAQYNEVRTGINATLAKGGSEMFKELGCSQDVKDNNGRIAAGSRNCFIMGRLINFEKEAIRSSYVVLQVNDIGGFVNDGSSHKLASWPDSSASTEDNLKDKRVNFIAINKISSDSGLSPTIKNLNYGNSFSSAWITKPDINNKDNSSAELFQGKDKDNESYNNIVILRSPTDGSLFTVYNLNLEKDNHGWYRFNLRDDGKAGGNSIKKLESNQKIALTFHNGGMGYKDGLICIPAGDSAAGISNNYNIRLGKDSSGNVNNSPDNKKLIANECNNWEEGK